MSEEATKTIQTRLHIAPGERSWLHDACLASARYSTRPSASNSKGTLAPRYKRKLTATISCGTTSARSSAKPSKRGTLTNRSKSGGKAKTTPLAATDATEYGQIGRVPARDVAHGRLSPHRGRRHEPHPISNQPETLQEGERPPARRPGRDGRTTFGYSSSSKTVSRSFRSLLRMCLLTVGWLTSSFSASSFPEVSRGHSKNPLKYAVLRTSS